MCVDDDILSISRSIGYVIQNFGFYRVLRVCLVIWQLLIRFTHMNSKLVKWDDLLSARNEKESGGRTKLYGERVYSSLILSLIDGQQQSNFHANEFKALGDEIGGNYIRIRTWFLFQS